MKNGPDLWDAVLTHVRTVHPSAVIAGGCVRDYLHGITPKDIDVFIPARRNDPCPTLPVGDSFRLIRTVDPQYVATMGADPAVVFVDTYLATVAISEWEVQIIALDLPEFSMENVVDRIDIGLCRVGYSRQSPKSGLGLTYGVGFWGDHGYRRMTICRADDETQYAASVRRYERLLDKFPGYELWDGRKPVDAAPL